MLKSKINKQPIKWIIEQINLLAPKRRIQVLDFASGNGRNSIQLAGKNRIITAIDKDSIKLAQYDHFEYINTICFDLETDQNWPLKEEYYDIIIVVNYLYRPKIKKLMSLLKNGGYLFYETFSVGNEIYGSPKNPNFLLKDRELLEIFGQDLLPLSFYDGQINNGKIVIKQRAGFKKGVFKKTPCC